MRNHSSQPWDKEVGNLVIDDLARKVYFGERRLRHLREKLSRGTGPGGASEAAQEFIREEIPYHDAALQALRFHEASLAPETSVVKTLQDLVDELKAQGLPQNIEDHDRLHELYIRARRVLRMVTT